MPVCCQLHLLRVSLRRGFMMRGMEATHIVHWPGKDTAACAHHASLLRKLAVHMGFELSVTPCDRIAFTARECANCANEAKRPRPPPRFVSNHGDGGAQGGDEWSTFRCNRIGGSTH